MIANIGPNSGSCEHTLNSLRYADRVKQLKKGPNQAQSQTIPSYHTHTSSSNGSKSARTSSSTSTTAVSAYMPHQHQHQHQPPRNKVSRQSIPYDRSVLPSSSADFLPGNISTVSSSPVRPSTSVVDRDRDRDCPPSSIASSNSPMRPSTAIPNHLRSNPPSYSFHSNLPHADLCAHILAEEDRLVHHHRLSIDARMSSIRSEMELLRRFDSLGCTVDEYVKQLDELLQKSGNG